MDPLASEALQPHTLGRYEVLSLLGRGGMANVYLGRHTGEAGFQRLYAIKVLHPHLAEEEAFINMLFEEARIAARLHHPNVVPIVDLGSQDGVHYVVMEYVEGCALSVLLRKHGNSRPARLLIPIILDALNGLHAAHTLTDDNGSPMHLVHRDVSPQNILVGTDGTARITDFGIAKAESRISSTRPGVIKGKILYMSPEQIRDGANVDCRADVFSIGVLLWSSLTGQQLFQAATEMEGFTNILKKKIERPSTVGLKPPPVLDAICLRALERDRNRRPSSASEMEDALRAVSSANGLLGSKREVAEWVVSATGPELVERALAVRATSHITPPGGSRSRAGKLAPEDSSEHRVASAFSSGEECGAVPCNSLEMSVPATPVISQLTQRREPSRTRLRLVVGAALVTLASATTIQVFLFSRGLQTGATLSAAPRAPARVPTSYASPQATPPPAVASTSPGETVPLPPPSQTSSASTANAEPPPATRRSRERAPRAQLATPIGGTPLARTAPPKPAPEPTRASSPSPTPTISPTPPPQTKKKAPVWDNDSPVPPQ